MKTRLLGGILVGATALFFGCRAADSTTPGGGGSTQATSSSASASASGSGGDVGGGGASSSSSSGGGGNASLPHCAPTDPRATPAIVFAEPDAGEAPYVESLNKAKKQIRLVVYEMGYGKILDALVAQSKAGLDVRIILDQAHKSTNQKYFDQLTAAGAKVKWSDPKFYFTHAKSFVVDDVEAMISTGNYLVTDLEDERNFVVKDDDPDDVASLAAVLDADWAGTTPNLDCTRLLVSPVNSRQRILDLIASAKSTLDIESMEFSDTDVENAVVARAAAGVKVRVLLADPSWISDNTAAATFLAAHQITAQRLATPHLHVKAISVDGERAYVGSENFSYTSLSENREIGVVVTEAAGLTVVADAFSTDWAKSSVF